MGFVQLRILVIVKQAGKETSVILVFALIVRTGCVLVQRNVIVIMGGQALTVLRESVIRHASTDQPSNLTSACVTTVGKAERVMFLLVTLGVDMDIVRTVRLVNASQDGIPLAFNNNVMPRSVQNLTQCAGSVLRLTHGLAPNVSLTTIYIQN